MSEEQSQSSVKSCAIAGCAAVAVGLIVVIVLLARLFVQSSPPDHDSHARHKKQQAPANALELTFTYGSEKKKWIAEVTTQFNNERHKTPGGKAIFVHEIPMGSGESKSEILEGRREVHVWSPASEAFIRLGNAESQAKAGNDMIGDTRQLVLSPVVIATWKPMAETMGWPEKRLGWSDIIELAKKEKGWAALGHPEWGAFKFGHTHPEYSNSGLISLLAEVYAGAGKQTGLTLADVAEPETAEYLRSIERAVVHYGSSTGFFGRKMFKGGPAYLSAAVLYENMVIESYEHDTDLPMVAIYPKEGTFWSDHPAGVVARPWVTEAHRQAAEIYLDYLMAAPQQEKALRWGFRPGNLEVQAGSPVDQAHGVDPAEPKTKLAMPLADVMSAVIELWRENKKHSNIVLVLDTSGSMKQQSKMTHAKAGAQELVGMLGAEDRLSVITFSSQVNWFPRRSVPMSEGREDIRKRLAGLFPGGATALYDATHAAMKYLRENHDPEMIAAVVVLTDGRDSGKGMRYEQLIADIRRSAEAAPTRIFTIAYGEDADEKPMEGIAEASQAKFFHGTPENIREVFKEISTFF